MYWWNASKLAEDLRDGQVDEKERFKYYLATFVAWTVVAQIFVYSGSAFNIGDFLSAAASLTVIVVGTVLCYRVNRRGDNTDFIARMICLGWPVGFRITVAVVAMFLVLAVLNALPSASLGNEAFLLRIPEVLGYMWGYFCGILFLWPYFHEIHREITHIAQTNATENAVQTRDHMLRENRGTSETEIKNELKIGGRLAGKLALGLLGGIGIMILSLGVPLHISSLCLPKRLNVLLSVSWGWGLVWLLGRVAGWERKHRV